MQKAAFRYVCSLALAVLAVPNLLAQKFELAKISLGMSEQDAKTAIGPGYQFLRQPVGGFPNLLFVYAANPKEHAGYSFALIDGKIEAFQFSKRFSAGEYPLMETLRNSVASKLWQPEKPNGSTWLSDTEGRRLVDDARLNCSYAANFDDLAFRSPSIPPAAADLFRQASLQPRLQAADPRCGIFVQEAATASPSNQTLAMSTGLTVKNIAVFSALAKQAQRQKQAQADSQTKQAGQVKSPY